jgi:FkbM family methyltransferase
MATKMLKKINQLLINYSTFFFIRKKTFLELFNRANHVEKKYSQLFNSIEQLIKLDLDSEIYKFVWSNKEKSKSQSYQDLIAYYILKKYYGDNLSKNFIEVGAYDGVLYSNTFYLEKVHNFKGVCVEPSGDIFSELNKNRSSINLQAFVTNKKQDSVIIEVKGMHTTIAKNSKSSNLQSVKCISLDTIIAEFFNPNEDIDFCSIDTEGTELEVLKSLNFNKYNIKLFCVENNNQSVNKFLSDKGYKCLNKNTNSHDNWFIK